MHRLLIIVCVLLCAACTTQQKPPTPFEVGTTKVEVIGCEKLKREVAQWNSENPNKKQKVADC